MKYKGYEAIIKYSDEDETFVGEVINTHDFLSFDGENIDEIKQSFYAVVDEYLEDCARDGRTPNKPFSEVRVRKGQVCLLINNMNMIFSPLYPVH